MKESRRGGFDANQAADAVWKMVDQLKGEFDKKVGTRMGRGDVRASVLFLLDERPMHGYQIIREIEDRTGGRWKPSAESVYPTLQMLADEGLVTVDVVEDRKVYALTTEGREAAEHVADNVPWVTEDEEQGPRVGALAKAAFELADAVTSMARSGNAQQREEAVGVLRDARRTIYSILSRD